MFLKTQDVPIQPINYDSLPIIFRDRFIADAEEGKIDFPILIPMKIIEKGTNAVEVFASDDDGYDIFLEQHHYDNFLEDIARETYRCTSGSPDYKTSDMVGFTFYQIF